MAIQGQVAGAENEHVRKMFESLVGCRIVDVIAHQPDQRSEVELGLVVASRSGGVRVVWALRDAEGNGPGWLEVVSAR